MMNCYFILDLFSIIFCFCIERNSRPVPFFETCLNQVLFIFRHLRSQCHQFVQSNLPEEDHWSRARICYQNWSQWLFGKSFTLTVWLSNARLLTFLTLLCPDAILCMSLWRLLTVLFKLIDELNEITEGG